MTAGGWAVFVAAAGLGATARYLLDGWIRHRTHGLFPWGTFVVNATGCLGLGVAIGLGAQVGSSTMAAVGTAGLGAFTTFSTMTFETIRLAEEGALNQAMANAAGSLAAGFVAAAAGIILGGAM